MNRTISQTMSQDADFLKLHVLVADHDKEVSKSIQRKIEMLGHSVEIAVSNKEILQKISAEVFNLILLDINFPCCDGIELIDDIRKISPSVNVVAMVEKSCPEVEKRTREKRVMYYLVKPFEQQELESILEHITKREIKQDQTER